MNNTIIQEGSILINAYPCGRKKGFYRINSMDYDADILVKPPKELSEHFYRAYRTTKFGGESVYIRTPVVIGEKDRYDYKAGLLPPPGINEESVFFTPNIYIPDLEILNSLGSGFSLISHYIDPEQEFYVHPNRHLEKLSSKSGIRFLGKISKIPNNSNNTGAKKRPQIKIELDSFNDFGIFENNQEILDNIHNLNYDFWWPDFKIDL